MRVGAVGVAKGRLVDEKRTVGHPGGHASTPRETSASRRWIQIRSSSGTGREADRHRSLRGRSGYCALDPAVEEQRSGTPRWTDVLRGVAHSFESEFAGDAGGSETFFQWQRMVPVDSRVGWSSARGEGREIFVPDDISLTTVTAYLLELPSP
jgi:hypothetical protein